MTCQPWIYCCTECPFCARDWFKWYADRMRAMHRPRRGEVESFGEAAATSVKAP